MDIEVIKALSDLPVVAILVYLLVRAQNENEKLLAALVASERDHARNLVSIIAGRVDILEGQNSPN